MDIITQSIVYSLANSFIPTDAETSLLHIKEHCHSRHQFGVKNCSATCTAAAQPWSLHKFCRCHYAAHSAMLDRVKMLIQ